MWGLSEKEINFICFGKGKHILKIVRLRNTARSPKRFTEWNEKVSQIFVRSNRNETLMSSPGATLTLIKEMINTLQKLIFRLLPLVKSS